MHGFFRQWGLLCFFAFIALTASAGGIKAVDPFSGLEWTVETTEGFQNLTNVVLAKERGTRNPVNELLVFKGILFHSDLQTYTNTRSYIKCAFNLGFKEWPELFWSNLDTLWKNKDFSESIKCIEFDAHFLLPISFFEKAELRPFVGFSFLDYVYGDEVITSYTNRLLAPVAGVQYSTRLHYRWLKLNTFVSYSPFLYTNFEETFLRYLYYGGELIATSHPVGFTFFMSFRNAFQKNRYYFNLEKHNDNNVFNVSEVGMSVNMRF